MRNPTRFAPLALLILGMTTLIAGAQTPPSAWRSPPEWTRDLVIYEIATKAFTSPNGPGSGTFESLRARLPYLQELGITGIWLTGHSPADPHHFYNIWTQYAVIEPDQIDPTLGTPEQFKAMIDEAHRRGIRIILEAITHGVMPASSLIKRHPDWFRGGSWGMTDYDWQGGHTDLDDWWVKTWTNYVTQFGVDGFRLDVEIYRPDLWARIRQNAVAAGHPIVLLNEGLPVIPGVTELTEKENMVVNMFTGVPNAALVNDIPRFYARKLHGPAHYRVEVQYEEGSAAEGATNSDGALRVRLNGFTTDRISFAEKRSAAGKSEVALVVSGVKDTRIKQIVASRLLDLRPDESKEEWKLQPPHPYSPSLTTVGKPPILTLYLKTSSPTPSIQLSSHDHGWEGFPLNQSPYSAQGSRAMMGYSLLMTPAIPLFMAGEEFDAGFHPLPGLSPDLFGGRNPGTGRWLYGGELDWSELEAPQHRAMFEDAQRMLAIRRQEKAILAAEINGEVPPRLVAVPSRSDIDVPVPYLRWHEGAGIVVAANRHTDRDVHLKLDIPVEKLGAAAREYRVTDLWNGGKGRPYSASQLKDFSYVIKRDQVPRGGLGLLKIEAIR